MGARVVGMDLWGTMTKVREIVSEEEMRGLVDESNGATVALFKYSPTCGISQVAQEAWEQWVGAAPEGVVLAQCDVIGAKPAARGVTSWMGILHQSPQILVLREGAIAAHTSHYSITEKWLREKVG